MDAYNVQMPHNVRVVQLLSIWWMECVWMYVHLQHIHLGVVAWLVRVVVCNVQHWIYVFNARLPILCLMVHVYGIVLLIQHHRMVHAHNVITFYRIVRYVHLKDVLNVRIVSTCMMEIV